MIAQPLSRPTYLRLSARATLHSNPVGVRVWMDLLAPQSGSILVRYVSSRPGRFPTRGSLRFPAVGGSGSFTVKPGHVVVTAVYTPAPGSEWMESEQRTRLLVV